MARTIGATSANSGKYVFETLKNFLFNNNFITKDWNALNILTQQASRVGALDCGIHSINEEENFSFFKNIKKISKRLTSAKK